MNPARHMIVAGLLLAISFPLLHAQQRTGPDWFLRQIFLLSDFNGDGQISKAEVSQIPQQWNYFATTAGFTECDLDGDQLLSREEMDGNAWKAMVFRLSQDEQELRRLQRDFSHLSQAQAKYLERYPGLARTLLGNVVWCRENPHVIKKLIRNRAWLREQPEVADALQNNLIFWMEHPKMAASYYERPPAGADAALYEAWRNGHKRYLNGLRTLPEKELLDFPYQTVDLPAANRENPRVTEVAPPPSSSQVARMASQESDSLRQELDDAKMVILQLEQVISTMSQGPEGNFEEWDSDQLREEIRLLRLELKMSRIEEDSLMAENIRQRRRLGEFETKMIADSIGSGAPTADLLAEITLLEEETRQLRRFISNQALEMESLNTKLRNNQRLISEQEQTIATLSSQTQEVPEPSGLDSLSQLASSRQSEIDTYQSEISRLVGRNDRSRLRVDSMRLVLIQSNLQRQALMDSLLTLSRLNRRKSDSLRFMAQAISSQEDTDEATQDLLAALRTAEEERMMAERQWLGQLDSMETLLSQARIASAEQSMAYRDNGDKSLRDIIYNLEKAQDDLYYDNEKLRQQLEASTVLSHEQEEVLRAQIAAVLKNNRRLEYQNRKLRRRVESRRLPTSTVAIARMDEANFELTEAKTRIQELESTNESLLIQLQTTQSYILQKMREEIVVTDQLSEEMKSSAAARYQADTLSIALANALRNSWPDTVAMLRQELKEIQREREVLERKAISAKVQYLQQRDSLVQVIDDRDLELIRMERNQDVSSDRFSRIQGREDQVSRLENQLEAKRQLLEQREQVIAKKLEEIAEQEEKYRQLERWEAELKRREQRLNVAENGEE